MSAVPGTPEPGGTPTGDTGSPGPTATTIYDIRTGTFPEGTEVSVTAQTQPKGGPLSPIIARRMAKGLTKGLAGLIDELDTAARARAVG